MEHKTIDQVNREKYELKQSIKKAISTFQDANPGVKLRIDIDWLDFTTMSDSKPNYRADVTIDLIL